MGPCCGQSVDYRQFAEYSSTATGRYSIRVLLCDDTNRYVGCMMNHAAKSTIVHGCWYYYHFFVFTDVSAFIMETRFCFALYFHAAWVRQKNFHVTVRSVKVKIGDATVIRFLRVSWFIINKHAEGQIGQHNNLICRIFEIDKNRG